MALNLKKKSFAVLTTLLLGVLQVFCTKEHSTSYGQFGAVVIKLELQDAPTEWQLPSGAVKSKTESGIETVIMPGALSSDKKDTSNQSHGMHKALSSSELLGQISQAVVTVSGPGMDPIITSLYVNNYNSSASGIINDVPAGADRKIKVELKNSQGIVHYEGQTEVAVPADHTVDAYIFIVGVGVNITTLRNDQSVDQRAVVVSGTVSHMTNGTMIIKVNDIEYTAVVKNNVFSNPVILKYGWNTIRAEALGKWDEIRINANITKTDILATLFWEGGELTDVDLHITEPGGEECYFNHMTTASGGKLDVDDVDGYGPENYSQTDGKAKTGLYRVEACYYSDEGTVGQPVVVKVLLTLQEGASNQFKKTFGPQRIDKASSQKDNDGTHPEAWWHVTDFTWSGLKVAKLSITEPAAGGKWIKGVSQPITWISEGDIGSYVKIELYKDGSYISTIVSSTANDGLYNYTPATSLDVANNYKVKISSAGISDFQAVSAPFEISGNVTVIEPKSATVWQLGQPNALISWDTGGTGGTVSISLYKGSSLITTIVPSTENDGSYQDYNVPSGLTTGTDYRIKITKNDANYDYSDYFTIYGKMEVTEPSTFTTWTSNQQNVPISWTTGGTGGNVSIDLYKGVTLVSTIIASTANDGVYNEYDVPKTLVPGVDYRIKVSKDANYFDYSDYFAVYNQIEVTEPTSTTYWIAGQKNVQIAWKSGGLGGNVSIELFKGTAMIETVVASTANDGSYNEFDVPNSVVSGSDYHVRVYRDENFNDDSADFPVTNLAPTIYVAGGSFSMGSTSGSSNEAPVHTVTLNSFYISRYEVTNTEFAVFLNSYGKETDDSGNKMIYTHSWGVRKNGTRWEPQPGYENNPVIDVTWYGAAQYAKWAGCRLPTEAEWEYAARGGLQSLGYTYSGSNTISEVAYYSYNSYGIQSVGRKKSNELGIYDMSGNVSEWCQDWYGAYSSASVSNPQGPATGSYRVLRGGSWSNNSSYSRVATRISSSPSSHNDEIGFRVVR